jgi:hypothetical protein
MPALCRECSGSDWVNNACSRCKTFPTLGYQVVDWIESRCAIPDRELVGEPFLLTDEQALFFLHFYRLAPDTGAFVYHRGAQLTRPQKWGKGPLAAAWVCAEAQGPVLFDGWDASGEPVGKPWPTPLVQITAVSEDQTANVYSALLPMIELGALHGEIEDTGIGRINLPGGGRIEPVTASGRTRLGQRLTAAVQDQTESWLQSNGGRVLADNQRRNIAGMGGRWLSTPNAWDPTEDSVAQYTAEHEHEGVYHNDVEPPEGLSIRNKAERRRALKIAYGHAATGTRDGKPGGVRPWINLDKLDAEILALLPRDPAQGERWFLNRKQAAEAKAFSGTRWAELAKPEYFPARDSLIVIGVDGARYVDALAIIATEVTTGFQWPIGIWERPHGAPENYEHSFAEVDGAVQDAFDQFNVWRMYIDPQYIDYLVEIWHGRWGEKRIFEWPTNRPRQACWMVRNYTDAISSGDMSHIGDEMFTKHVKNAVRRKQNVYDDEHRPMYTIAKDRQDSPNKIDGAMAAALSWEARGDAIAADAQGTRVSVYESRFATS